MGVTVGGLLGRTVARLAENVTRIVPSQDVRWANADLTREADQLATGLIAMGPDPGDRIGIRASNLAEAAEVAHA
ncbi:hypothetical protein DDZ14_08005 [Maritimibacter sp. 55A14]|nr:hypothetical protein DDZ14_08005 [Maritimibacter sp. 55A14]